MFVLILGLIVSGLLFVLLGFQGTTVREED